MTGICDRFSSQVDLGVFSSINDDYEYAKDTALILPLESHLLLCVTRSIKAHITDTYRR